MIIDCSMAMAWCFADEETPQTRSLFQQVKLEAALVPSLWFAEIANVLIQAERKKRIAPGKVSEFVEVVESLQLEVDDEWPGRAFEHLMSLCRTHRLTSYDAVYLDLAMRRRLPLATLDDGLLAAGAVVGLPKIKV